MVLVKSVVFKPKPRQSWWHQNWCWCVTFVEYPFFQSFVCIKVVGTHFYFQQYVKNMNTFVILSDTWSTCTHMNVIRGVWATPTSSRQPSTVIGGRADDRALAAPSLPTRPTGRPPCSLRRRSPRPVWAWQWAPTGPRWPPSRRSRKVRFVYYAALTSHGIHCFVLSCLKTHECSNVIIFSCMCLT